jgi:adenylate kinase
MRLVVLGRQGAGKGTQCARLAERFGVVHVATGDAFRTAVTAKSGLGRQVAKFVAAGELVPDDIAVQVVAEAFARSAAGEKGFVLDGFPRTVRQAERLDALLAPANIDVVIDLCVDVDVVLRRLLNRRVCGGCGHIAAAAPNWHGPMLCADCGGTYTRRADDTEPLIRRRLAIYDEQIQSVLSWYASRVYVRTVDGHGPEGAVSRRVEAAILPPAPMPVLDPERAVDAGSPG